MFQKGDIVQFNFLQPAFFVSSDEYPRSVIRVGFGMSAPQLIRKYVFPYQCSGLIFLRSNRC